MSTTTSIVHKPWLLGGQRGGLPPSLDLKFLAAPLDPRITFTRASVGTYFDSSGTMQTATSGTPRFDYDPVTHALRGLLIEEARTNNILQSGDVSNAAWTKFGSVASAPVATANQTAAPDGTVTAARLVYPAVTAGASVAFQNFAITAAPYTFSVYLKGAVGGEQLYLNANAAAYFNGGRITLTTAWQRYSVSFTGTAQVWWFEIGTDKTDVGQANTSAQTIFVWGGQVEQGAFPTSYIPTTAAAVTRAQDLNSMSSSPWMVPATGSWFAEFILLGIPSNVVVVGTNTSGGQAPLTAVAPNQMASFDGAGLVAPNTFSPNAVTKCVSAIRAPLGTLCLNGGAVASGAQTGINITPVGFIEAVPGASANNGSGYMRRFRYWPRVLSNAEMQQVTR